MATWTRIIIIRTRRQTHERHESHPLGRIIGDGGRNLVHGGWDVPSSQPSFVSYHQPMGTRPHLGHRHVSFRPARPYGDLRQASESGWVAWPGQLSPV